MNTIRATTGIHGPSEDLSPRQYRPIPAQLSRHLAPANERGCRLWTAARNADGYGVVKVNGRQMKAHRAVYEATRGPIPEGLVLLHACDQRACCSPDHLTPGTHRENAEDRHRKGRSARQQPKSPGAPAGRRYW